MASAASTTGSWSSISCPCRLRAFAKSADLEFLRSEDGMDVYWNPETEEEEFTVQSNNKD